MASEWNMKTVNDLTPGDRGKITAIGAAPGLKQRLMDMGIIEGAEVEMVRTAPLGDPVEIKVYNTLIALRKNEAETLLVEYQGEKHRERKRHRRRTGRKSQ